MGQGADVKKVKPLGALHDIPSRALARVIRWVHTDNGGSPLRLRRGARLWCWTEGATTTYELTESVACAACAGVLGEFDCDACDRWSAGLDGPAKVSVRLYEGKLETALRMAHGRGFI